MDTIELGWDTGIDDEFGIPAIGIYADGIKVFEISMLDAFQAIGKDNIMKLVTGLESLPIQVQNWPKQNDFECTKGTIQ